MTRIVLLFLMLVSASKVNASSLCSESFGQLTCPHQEVTLNGRIVRYQLPLTAPPAGGYPVAVFFQGSVTPVLFERTALSRFNTLYELKTIEALLNAGYAVIAPETEFGIAWYSNTPGLQYESTSDVPFITNLLAKIRNGDFGPINANKKFAIGFSSGGYNTSRMAVSYPGEFQALIIQSGSYATCLGPICSIPALPANHPPTFFLHSVSDLIVPYWTMQLYYNALKAQGITTEISSNYLVGHGWNTDAPEKVLTWLNNFMP